MEKGDRRGGPGTLRLVGIGPGPARQRTQEAVDAIRAAEVVVGYAPYLELIRDLTGGKRLLASGMTREAERARWAIDAARGGEDTALVSRGDSGVYGMAGLVMEILEKEPPAPPLQIVPGVTAAQAAASALGAPLMCDFAVISLSDLLVSWEMIRLRLEKVAAADLVTVLYNPKSRKRGRYIFEARDIFLRHRSPSTPVGIVRQASMTDQRVVMSDLARFTEHDIDMLTTVVIGGSMTAVVGTWMLTRRGYDL